MNTRPDADEIARTFSYDPETGIIRWKISPCGRKMPGAIAGCVSDGYLYTRLRGIRMKNHQIAWCLMTGDWPDHEVDHEDRDSLNNRWSNLRSATITQQRWNRRLPLPKASGLIGAQLLKNGRWMAQIRINGKSVHLGCFGTAEEASGAYKAAARARNGSFKVDLVE